MEVDARSIESCQDGFMQVGVRRSEARPTPAANGHGREIPALDGVRAFAALSVVFFHSFPLWAPSRVVFGVDITPQWNYAQTGVHLFFVLSGFLLFLPFARAMLQSRPLPSTRRFYARRARRILPTYWVCLIVLVLVQLPQFLSPTGVANILAHVVFLHDNFPEFNQSIEGPFWTLALEAQFYLALPLFAWGIAKIVASTRSAARLTLAVCGLLFAVLGLRALDAFAQSRLRFLHGFAYSAVFVPTRLTQGFQGKFLEVFALGMLCAVCYLVLVEERRISATVVRGVGLMLLAVAGLAYAWLPRLLTTRFFIAPSADVLAAQGNPLDFFGPLLTGAGYAALILAVLLLGGPLGEVFAWGPLRLIGVMSYSLYLWHLPIVQGWMPYTQSLELPWRVVTAFAFSYLSYLVLERPFLAGRWRLAKRASGRAASLAGGTAGKVGVE
jgi:peptidoglycan/LPS O-acetylase OafA/YrhL